MAPQLLWKYKSQPSGASSSTAVSRETQVSYLWSRSVFSKGVCGVLDGVCEHPPIMIMLLHPNTPEGPCGERFLGPFWPNSANLLYVCGGTKRASMPFCRLSTRLRRNPTAAERGLPQPSLNSSVATRRLLSSSCLVAAEELTRGD